MSRRRSSALTPMRGVETAPTEIAGPPRAAEGAEYVPDEAPREPAGPPRPAVAEAMEEAAVVEEAAPETDAEVTEGSE